MHKLWFLTVLLYVSEFLSQRRSLPNLLTGFGVPVAVHALELIKYQQIISRAVTKFKGLAWVSYDQQFRHRAAYDLSLSWDKVDLELWTVTFAGLVKPHCNVCSSPYHAEDVCPSADPNRKLRQSQTVCFDFNKPTGCRRRNCSYPHVCRRCHSSTHVVANCPQQQPSNASKISKPSEQGKK